MKGKIFITGGAGTLGRAIIERGKKEEWDAQFTIYSTDPAKHHKLLSDHPDVTSVIGDILDYNSLVLAMAGHDIVIHAAAMKYVPEGEKFPHYTFEINVNGSYNVIQAALQARVKQVVGISTDKACHPVNAYGASKMMMERLFQEAALGDMVETKFHLVRYGNVLGSNGSFIHNWKQHYADHGFVVSTDRRMTRFWLTVDDAVDLIEMSLDGDAGEILIPMPRALSIGEIEDYLLEDITVSHMGMRPGEKMHEELLTEEESRSAFQKDGFVSLLPGGLQPYFSAPGALSSLDAPRIPKEEFIEMIGGWEL
jgi:UDP-N-acetylglucosamine 4,6-dehydratase